MKHVVVDALRLLQTRFGVCLLGYVIMPEHLHFLVYAHAKGADAPVVIRVPNEESHPPGLTDLGHPAAFIIAGNPCLYSLSCR